MNIPNEKPESQLAAASDFRFHAQNWKATALGPIETWPVPLRISAGLMSESRFPKAIFWGPELITIHNDAFRPLLGDKPNAQGRPWNEIWAEAWEDIRGFCEAAFEGKATYIEDFGITIGRYGYPEECFFTFCYSPIRDETGTVRGVMDTVIETTAKVVAERALAVRNAELAHRIKNTLSIVSVIVRQSLRGASSLDDAWKAASDRITALSQAQALLMAGTEMVSAPIDEVLRSVLRPHLRDADQVTLTGPHVELSDRQALSLSLAINELATNAVKYGALSVRTGTVRVNWNVTSDPVPHLTLDWAEAGGPVVTAPERRGFGSALLHAIVPSDFSGSARVEYAPEGVCYHLEGELRA